MFDDVLRKLRQLERGVQIPIQLELDDNGYLDRVCPSDDCGTHFKVMFEDWRDIVRDEEVFCPLCRHDAESTDMEYARTGRLHPKRRERLCPETTWTGIQIRFSSIQQIAGSKQLHQDVDVIQAGAYSCPCSGECDGHNDAGFSM